MPALVIIPTYNERDTAPIAIERLLASAPGDVDVLVVDDGSPDGTGPIVESRFGSTGRVAVLHRPGKLGLGTAYVEGFAWGLERGYDALVEMDADLSHDPADAGRLLAALDGADLAIGSRYVRGGSVSNWGPLRRVLSLGGNLYARALLGFDVRDSTSGFRAYRAAALDPHDLESVRSEGYAFQIEMTRRLHRRGARIVEVPITFVERASGRSKMSRRIVLEALASVTRWGFADRVGRRGKRP